MTLLDILIRKVVAAALTLSRGDPLIFLRSPISVTMLIIALIAVLLVLLPSFRKTREEAFVEED
jgi:putative tricarboxylic transport membrane protein